MQDVTTLHALLESAVYYASPLLMLGGLLAFAACLTQWLGRK